MTFPKSDFNELKLKENFYGPKFVNFNQYTIEITSNSYGSYVLFYENNKPTKCNFIENIFDIKVYLNQDNKNILLSGKDDKNQNNIKIIDLTNN
jgi:hypothetical protein